MISNKSSIAAEMFSVDNLQRIATQPSPEIKEVKEPIASAKVEASAAEGQVIDGKFVIPVELSAGNFNLALNLSAKLSIKISVDLDDLMDAQKIPDRVERIEATRQIIKMSEPHCELKFNP